MQITSLFFVYIEKKKKMRREHQYRSNYEDSI